MGANKATTATITTEAHRRNQSHSERGIEQEAEIYCAAWALVLARHGGDIVEDGQADVSFGCAVGAGEQGRIDAPPLLKGEHQHSAAEVRILHLAFSPDQSLAGFVQYVKTKLKTLAGAKNVNKREWESLTAPLKSVLRIGGGGAALSHEEDGSVEHTTTFRIDIPGYTVVDAREPAIQAHPENSAVTKILIAHLRQALQCLRTLPPSTPVSQVDLFSDVDRRHLMELNKESAPYVDETLTGLLARQVHLQPSAPAVCSWDRNLSYAELDGLSNKLASELIRKGARPEESVALCFEKSALAIIAMTAVLKTGANFVNLGISMPTQRQSAILAACNATLLIVDASNEFRLSEHISTPGVCVADFSFVEALPTMDTFLPEVKPHYVAAITFTSGSTGTPKGIVVEHGSIATSCDAMCTRYGVGPGTRILQFASYTFDASVGDIFYALARGACVCSPSEQERVDELAPAARRMAVNWAFLTPSVLSLLEPRDIPSLKTLLLGGEPPSPKHVDLWAKSISLHLVMGPAECAIYCAGSAAIKPGQSPTTFGWAAGCRMWIVDSRDHTKLAPVGCPGELIVEGRTVARGYLNDEERTRKAFLDEVPWLPPSANPLTRRLYKSGDLVRLKIEDGSFSFMARKDTQVKLHGQRVELGEIEQNLKNIIPDVRSTAAILNMEAGEINHRHPLIVFLVLAKDSAALEHAVDQVLRLTLSGLDLLRNAKEKLATILPTYMIPSLFIPLASIPFTANGKRDTAMLRQITQSLSKEDIQSYSLSHQIENGEDARPLTENEQQLRKLWASTLHIEEADIGASSDFVEQGGDSLAAMGLVTAASKVGLHLPMSTIMAHPCLSDMASEVNELSSLESDPIPNPFSILSPAINIDDLKARCAEQCGINVDQINDVYPATPIQDMLLNASLRRPGTYILTMKFQLPSSTQLERFIATWNEVIRSADILRTRLVADPEAGLLQVVLSDFTWDIYDTFEEYETQNDHLPMEHGTRLARLSVIRNSSSGKTPIFIFTAHHVLYDAFQLTMTFDRVSELYKTVSILCTITADLITL